MFHNIWCLTPHSEKLIESIKNIWDIWNENIFKDVLQLDLSKLCLSCNQSPESFESGNSGESGESNDSG